MNKIKSTVLNVLLVIFEVKYLCIQFLNKHKIDLLILAVLGTIFMIVKLPITTVSRHVEMYIILNHLPDSFTGIIKSLFERWPAPNGHNYRPLQLTIFPYIYFHLFNWNHQYWLTANLLISCCIPLLVYLLVKLITESRIAALFSSLFLFSYYILNHSYTEAMQYDPDSLYIVLYLAALILFIWGVKENKHKISIAGTVFFILSLMSKEVCAMLPILLVLYLFLFQAGRLKDFYRELKGSIRDNARYYKACIVIIKNKKSLIHHFIPYLIVFIVYMSFRVIIPALHGRFDTGVMKTHSFTLSLDRITETICNIILCTVQTPYFVQFKSDSSFQFVNVLRDSSFSTLDFVMYGLFAVTIVFFLIQAIRVNRVVIFGFTLFLVQIFVYVFMNAPSAPHHYNSAFVGPAIIFGEMIRHSYSLFSQSGFSVKSVLRTLIYFILGMLFIIMIVNGYVGVRDYIKQYDYLSNEGGLWQNRTFEAIEKAIPRPEERKSNTVFYIKNSEVMQEIGDFYYMCIKPAYYGKKNILITHSYNIHMLKSELAKFKIKDSTIIVLEHVDMFKALNVTNNEDIMKVQQFMDK